ncbi:MAG: leucine-rich repeat domain-containing protein, partial [Ruminococcus sp.]|nr:leucine-rich repeat domain-containing protein [Ruminococcus sp.]
MNAIIFWTITTAVVAGLSLTCVIEAISTAIKKRKHGKRISIKMYNSSAMWWYIAFAILHGLKAITEIYGLKYCDFTESVLSKIKIVCYLLIFITFIFAFFLRTRAYITEKGIITHMSFLPASVVKYSVKKEYEEYIINIYTKKEKPSYIYCTKKEKSVSMLENLYNEFDGNAANVKFKSGTAKYLLTLLCTSLIFIGGILAWYEIEKPILFVGDKIVKTDSEYAIFHLNMLYGEHLQIPYDIIDKLYEERDVSEKITSKDTAALKKMPNLKYLNLMCNNIDDLTEIGDLTQLEMLRFGGGDMYEKPTDFSPLKNLKKIKYFTGAGCNNLT